MKHDLLSVHFPTPEEGWSCGRWGTILKTDDGGNNWRRQNSDTDFTLTSIHFVDAENGWAVGALGTIVHTADGGQTWTKQQCPVEYYLMSVFFTDLQNGWIVTERTTILNTRDGGDTWEIQFNDLDYILKSVSFCDAQNGWAVGEYGYTYHTTDGGRSWVHEAGEFFINEYGDYSGEPFLFAITAVDPSTAWAVGIEGAVKKTTDGGQTWQKVDAGVGKTHLFGIVVDQHDVYIAADGKLLGSRDGGITFGTIITKPPITYGWLYGICKTGGGGVVSVGSEGWIYRNRQNDSNWERVAW